MRRPPDPIGHIPGEYGRPIVGHTMEFIRDAERWATGRHERFGPVFRTNVLFNHGVLLATPDAARTVLLDRDDIFSSERGWHDSIGALFRRGLMLRDFDDHRLHRRIMQVAFRSDAMRTYVDMMNPIIESSVRSWSDVDDFSFYNSAKTLTLSIAAQVFVGEQPGPEIEAINRAFVDAVNASITPIRTELPGLPYKRGMDGRRCLERYFADRIGDRLGSSGADMFTRLCNAETDQGERFSDEEIIDHMIFLLLAAHDTTTATLSTMAWEVARRPAWQERMRDEILALDAPVLGYEDRDALEVTEWVFREAMRLHPPVPFIPRVALADAELAGYRIPAGTGVSICSLLIHRLEDYWSDPLAFDPERFSTERAEHRQHSHVYLPFGGGAHTCIGMHFAGLMVKAILVQVLQRYRLATHPGQTESIKAVPIPKPRKDLPLVLEPVG